MDVEIQQNLHLIRVDHSAFNTNVKNAKLVSVKIMDGFIWSVVTDRCSLVLEIQTSTIQLYDC